MELGLIGLGRMGNSMAQRLLAGGHTLVVYDPSPEAGRAAVEGGAVRAGTISDLAARLARPRAVWVMVPSGEPTESTVNDVAASLSAGDIVVDGGNSYYKDSMRRGAVLLEQGIHFLDVGTSGGVWGLKEGYCLMVGGDEAAFGQIESILQSLAPSPDRGYGHVGPSGAGHFVKMIHNGIEYGLMQAYAEGMELMRAKQEFHLDLHQVAEIWRHGSVVRSWLLDLTARALKDDPSLEHVAAYVEDSGEGRWTVMESVELAVPTPVITESLHERFRSRRDEPFSARLLAALRQQFGGHRVRKAPGA
jgi:6-phosphogluconate dehydrogenase